MKCVLLVVLLQTMFGNVHPCETNCTKQAGVPCTVVSGEQECPQPQASVYQQNTTALPKLTITAIPNGSDAVGLNISWQYTDDMGAVTGFQLQYRNATAPQLLECLLYNLTAPPVNEAIFWNNCSSSPSRMVVLSAHPQSSTQNYDHRLVSGYKQDHGESTACWQPALIIVHNDSCTQTVDVEFYVAPEEFEFRNYKIDLRPESDDDGTLQIKNVYVSTGIKVHRVNFTGVKDGNYRIVVNPEPYDYGDKCYCKPGSCAECQCIAGTCSRSCGYTRTNPFIMKANHLKCVSPTTPPSVSTNIPSSPQPTLPETQTDIAIIITVAIFVLGVLIGSLVVIICVVCKSSRREKYLAKFSDKLSLRTAMTVKSALPSSVFNDVNTIVNPPGHGMIDIEEPLNSDVFNGSVTISELLEKGNAQMDERIKSGKKNEGEINHSLNEHNYDSGFPDSISQIVMSSELRDFHMSALDRNESDPPVYRSNKTDDGYMV